MGPAVSRHSVLTSNRTLQGLCSMCCRRTYGTCTVQLQVLLHFFFSFLSRQKLRHFFVGKKSTSQAGLLGGPSGPAPRSSSACSLQQLHQNFEMIEALPVPGPALPAYPSQIEVMSRMTRGVVVVISRPTETKFTTAYRYYGTRRALEGGSSLVLVHFCRTGWRQLPVKV